MVRQILSEVCCASIAGIKEHYLLGHALLLGFMGAVIGLLTGCILGNLAATSWCGIAATVIHISETNDSVNSKLETLCSLQKELLEKISKVPGSMAVDSQVSSKIQPKDDKNPKKENSEEKDGEIKTSQGHFNYDEHKTVFNKLSSTKELLDYLENLDNKDEYFRNEVLAKVKEFILIERIYGGNRYEDALRKLKELS